jgi:hypothetical protein
MPGSGYDNAIRAPVKSIEQGPVQFEQIALTHDVAMELRDHGNIAVGHER